MASRLVDAISHSGQRNKVDGKRADDTSTRWLVQKRTYFKGNYDRVLTVAKSSIGTQMPNLQFTNVYTLTPEFNVKSLMLEKDCVALHARPNGKVRPGALPLPSKPPVHLPSQLLHDQTAHASHSYGHCTRSSFVHVCKFIG
jgi:hypothetical protein